MKPTEELLLGIQELLNLSKQVQHALSKVQRLQENVLPDNLRVDAGDYFSANIAAENLLNANIKIASQLRTALKQISEYTDYNSILAKLNSGQIIQKRFEELELGKPFYITNVEYVYIKTAHNSSNRYHEATTFPVTNLYTSLGLEVWALEG